MYQQLQPEERMRIDFWLAMRLSRELARKTQTNGLYSPRAAQASRNTRNTHATPIDKLPNRR
ncbi:MAG: hypothetical protein V3Q69_01375 [Burkholderia sp.]